MNARISIQNAVFGEGINNPVNPSQAKTVSSIKKPNNKKSQEKVSASTATSTNVTKRDQEHFMRGHKVNHSRGITKTTSQQQNTTERIAENHQNGNPAANISIPGCSADGQTQSVIEPSNVIRDPTKKNSDDKTTDEKSNIVAPLLPTNTDTSANSNNSAVDSRSTPTITDTPANPNNSDIDSRSPNGTVLTSTEDDDFFSLIGRADGRVSELDQHNDGITSLQTANASGTSS
ncbi:Hypothetical predicted protein [Mytilus galloprovincialis]|uniref:Uncharacterized protein n=1 Tax=Mytilus galloprovincialis TaxID=29158 RepID=A0A8B6EHK4_MYTGA|nr:Hypothetical predicted protein [Mytilus galloprovincialis]